MNSKSTTVSFNQGTSFALDGLEGERFGTDQLREFANCAKRDRSDRGDRAFWLGVLCTLRGQARRFPDQHESGIVMALNEEAASRQWDTELPEW